MFYHEMRTRNLLMKLLARQKTKIDNAFRARANEKYTFESDSSSNAIPESMKKLQLKGMVVLNNQSSDKSNKFRKNLDIEARQILCEAAKKRVRAIMNVLMIKQKRNCVKLTRKKKNRENLDDEAKGKSRISDQKRKQFVKM